MFPATPTFVEAPADVEVKEGGTLKVPCRAQGRPSVRIVWDRIGANSNSLPVNEEISQYLEEETQDELLAKAKIMSLRSKREKNITSEILNEKRIKRDAVFTLSSTGPQIPDLYLGDINRNKRNQEEDLILSEFKQIMRDEHQESYDKAFRKKRQIDENDFKILIKRKKRIKREEDEEIDDDEDDDDLSPSDATPLLFFSTVAPTESTNLEISETGELIIREAALKDQVGIFFCYLIKTGKFAHKFSHT